MFRIVLLLLTCTTLRAACNLSHAKPQSGPSPTPESLLEAGHFLRARQLLKTQPEDAQTAWLLSKAETSLLNLDAAVAMAEKAVASDDANADYHVQLASAYGRVAKTASLFKQLSYARNAKKELDAALQLNPNSVDALFGLMLFYAAAPSFVGGDKQKAQQCAEAMTRIDPARGYLAQGMLAGDKKNPDAEEKLYRKAIKANPKFYEARAALAEFYLTRKSASSAESAACDALAIDPGRVQAWKVLAQAAIASKSWDRLLVVLARAKEAVPDNLGYYYSAALALEHAASHLDWAEDFLATYMASTLEGDEPTLEAAAKIARRLKRTAKTPVCCE